MKPRTHIIDVVAQQMDGIKTESEVDAILDCSLSSTVQTARNSKPLLDFEKYAQL